MSVETNGVPQLSSLKSLHHGQVVLSQYKQEDHIRIVDSYHSTGGYDDGAYLVQWDRESTEHYESRQGLSAYDNIFQPEVDYKVMPVYAKPIERTVSGRAKKRVEAFIDNVDDKGSNMTNYLKEEMTGTELNTSTFFVVTGPKEKVKNTDLTKLPYMINVDPLACSGYLFNNKGQLSILTWPLKWDNNTKIYEYQVWELTPDGGGEYYVVKCAHNENKTMTQERICEPFKVKAFPVRMVKLGIKKETYDAPPPKYRSTSKQLTQIFNIRNWTVSGFGDTNFSPLLIQTQTGELPAELALGDENALGYPEGMDAPSRLKVNIEHLEFQEKFCDSRELSIRKQMDSYTQIMDSSSEGARIEASRKIILYWANVGETSSSLENWVYDVALRNYIVSPYEVIVKYPIDYASLTPDVILEQIEKISQIFDIDGETKKTLFSTLINEVFGQDKDKAKEIIDAYSQDNNGLSPGDGKGVDENDDDGKSVPPAEEEE
jgi:hypothetical protein